MKVFLVGLFAAAFLAACSSGNSALRTLQLQSELSSEQARAAGLDSAKVSLARAALDSSKAAEKLRDEQLAVVDAELSNLRYRVVFATAELEAERRETDSLKTWLAADEKRLEAYRAVLKDEGGAK